MHRGLGVVAVDVQHRGFDDPGDVGAVARGARVAGVVVKPIWLSMTMWMVPPVSYGGSCVIVSVSATIPSPEKAGIAVDQHRDPARALGSRT